MFFALIPRCRRCRSSLKPKSVRSEDTSVVGVGRGFVSLAVAVAVAGTSIQFASPGAGAAASEYLTAYVGWGNPTDLSAAATAMKHQFAYGSDYVSYASWASMDDPYDEKPWRGKGYTMMWGIPMLPASGGSLSVGATGGYDVYFKKLAANLIADGQADAMLRLGWEFNESSFPWYAAGEAAAFVAYWRQIVTTMRAVPGAQFSFIWDPNRGDNGQGDLAMGNLESYYPGGAYVNAIGLDVYDQAWNYYPGASIEFEQIETQTWGLDWLASFANLEGKPIAIPEFGLGGGASSATPGAAYQGSGAVSGGDDGTFIQDMSTWAKANSVEVMAYWDIGADSIQDGRNPVALQALQAGF